MPVVLVVDDSAAIRMTLRKILTPVGIDVLEAPDGKKASEILQAEKVDAALLDLNMPGMSGIELAREIRTMPECAGVPILMFTTEWTEAKKAEAREAGVTSYLVKPSPALVVKQTVMALLNMK